jgi:polar amino acid transport system substrate-binding protein
MNGQFSRRAVIGFVLLGLLAAAPAMAGETLRMMFFDAFAPYSYMENGLMRGILPDAMTEACRRLGIPLENQGYPWERAQSMVKSGQADGFVTVPTAEKKSYALAGQESVITPEISLYTWAGNPNMERLQSLRSIDALRGLRVLDYPGIGWGKEYLAGLEVRLAPTLDQIFLMLAQKRGDAFAQINLVARYAIRSQGLGDQLVEIPKPSFPSVPFVLCLEKSSPFAARLGEFDETFQAMKDDGALDRIIARYN